MQHNRHRQFVVLGVLLLAAGLLAVPFLAFSSPAAARQAAALATEIGPPTSDGQSAPLMSNRLIVELASPPLAVYAPVSKTARLENGKLDFNAPEAQAYIDQLVAEQAAFVSQLQAVLPESSVSAYINEAGQKVEATYQVVFNGMAINPGSTSPTVARRILQKLDGVKAVYLDYAHQPELYASLPLINAPAIWSNTAVGGRDNAGDGVKVASVDGGILGGLYAAPMFDGTGWSYPPGWPAGGLGDTYNNNGKVIVSRAYFREWDPPAFGDEHSWPGVNGTSHGVHTSSTAAGNQVTAEYLGITETVSGVAPGAWLMSYRVFYYSVTGDGSFYNAEGIAALEDMVMDGADVVNNSWGGGPGSAGGEFDAIDNALLNAVDAGVFVSMSAGNAGPGQATTDHPSPDYISVAASTTDGTLASGRLNVTAPTPISPTLQDIPFSMAGFGPGLAPGGIYPYDYLPAVTVDPGNSEGCLPFTPGSFTGKAALIIRGTCEFGVKVLNAENAGAVFTLVYNNLAGGDTLINMGPGAVGNLVTIPSAFIGYSDGDAMLSWYNLHTSSVEITFDTNAYQAGNTPDVLASFSSRGPGIGNVLKPDITAPGVNILAQGYTPNTTGEDRHRGWGQVSGTSMASPHVAGAATILRQIHPNWTPAQIKSALMSTSKYLDIFDYDGSPAQPLEMGAGRLDLTNAADPGLLFDPPSLSYGLVLTGTEKTMTVNVTSVATTTETYTITLLDTSGGFPGVALLPGFTVSPTVITVAPGASASFDVTFDSLSSKGIGDNQGFVLLHSANYDAHLPAWARAYFIAPADVLIIDNDGSSSVGFPDYVNYYTQTLDAISTTYEILDVDSYAGSVANFLDAVELQAYKAVIYYTGDYFYDNGTFTVPTPLTTADLDAVNEYVANGGTLIAMGQDLASVWNALSSSSAPFAYAYTLGGTYLQDSINGVTISPTFVISSTDELPMAGINLDLSEMGDGAANQYYVDEISYHVTITDPTTIDPFFQPIFYHDSLIAVEQGTTGMAHREQPTLERPGVAYDGRSIYTTFGLEGINNNTGYSTREQMLKRALDWGWDNPTASVVITGNVLTVSLTASLSSNIPGVTGVAYRWDFGDGTSYTSFDPSDTITHTYAKLGAYTVRVEVLDSLGNHAIGFAQTYATYLPIIGK
jgi:subtilisin family serine protease